MNRMASVRQAELGQRYQLVNENAKKNSNHTRMTKDSNVSHHEKESKNYSYHLESDEDQ